MSMTEPAMHASGERARRAGHLISALVVVGFIVTATIGFDPLQDTLVKRDELTGGGDLTRQLAYSVCAVSALALAFLARRTLPPLASVPAALCVVLAWAWLSLAWSGHPEIAMRRLALVTIIASTVWAMAQLFQPDRLLALTRQALALLILANIAAAILFMQGVHQPGEVDPALVGDWRGLFKHKNEAGSIAAVAVILWLYHARATRRPWPCLCLALCTLFLLQTNSKSSIGFLLLSLVVGSLYDMIRRMKARRTFVLLLFGVLLAAGALALAAQQRNLENGLNDPEALTGRVQIWSMVLAYAADHPLGGAGFGSFWNVGSDSPALGYAESWVTAAPTAHNGYLDILAQLGVVGVVLALYSCVVVPLGRLLDDRLAGEVESGAVAALIIFCILHNITESSFLSDAPLWSMMLIALCIQQRHLSDYGKQRRAGSRLGEPPARFERVPEVGWR
jgi:O-antigen ligase